MRMSEKKKINKKLVGGIVAGCLVVGVGVGVLLANNNGADNKKPEKTENGIVISENVTTDVIEYLKAVQSKVDYIWNNNCCFISSRGEDTPSEDYYREVYTNKDKEQYANYGGGTFIYPDACTEIVLTDPIIKRENISEMGYIQAFIDEVYRGNGKIVRSTEDTNKEVEDTEDEESSEESDSSENDESIKYEVYDTYKITISGIDNIKKMYKNSVSEEYAQESIDKLTYSDESKDEHYMELNIIIGTNDNEIAAECKYVDNLGNEYIQFSFGGVMPMEYWSLNGASEIDLNDTEKMKTVMEDVTQDISDKYDKAAKEIEDAEIEKEEKEIEESLEVEEEDESSDEVVTDSVDWSPVDVDFDYYSNEAGPWKSWEVDFSDLKGKSDEEIKKLYDSACKKMDADKQSELTLEEDEAFYYTEMKEGYPYTKSKY